MVVEAMGAKAWIYNFQNRDLDMRYCVQSVSMVCGQGGLIVKQIARGGDGFAEDTLGPR